MILILCLQNIEEREEERIILEEVQPRPRHASHRRLSSHRHQSLLQVALVASCSD